MASKGKGNQYKKGARERGGKGKEEGKGREGSFDLALNPLNPQIPTHPPPFGGQTHSLAQAPTVLYP